MISVRPRLIGTSRAFSLIEIVLAVAVISFALVGILGLFPVAMKSALESRQETQAALIARSIFSGLSSNPAFVQEGSDKKEVKLDADKKITDLKFDENGIPASDSSTGSVSSGQAVFSAEIQITANNPAPGLSHVQVNLATPADAPAGSRGRSEYIFVSLLRQQ